MKTLLFLCMMTLLTIKRIQGLESSSTVLVVRMSTMEFQRFQSELPWPTLVETELPLFSLMLIFHEIGLCWRRCYRRQLFCRSSWEQNCS